MLSVVASESSSTSARRVALSARSPSVSGFVSIFLPTKFLNLLPKTRPCLQFAQAWRRLCRPVLQVNGAHRWSQGHAVPAAHARRPPLARYHQDR